VNAVAAAQASGVPLIRYMRPAWDEPADAAWLHVPTIEAAAAALPPNAHGFITTGHQGLEYFVGRDDCRLVARLIEVPQIDLGHMELLIDTPPHSLASERSLFDRYDFTHLVSKNSGGAATWAKLDVARERGATVIMVARPAYGPAHEVGTVDEAVAAVATH